MSKVDKNFTLLMYRAKCAGAINGLEQMDSRNHGGSLSQEFATDYNNMLAKLVELVPDLGGLLPPEASLDVYASGSTLCETSPAEMLMRYHQILKTIDVVVESKT